MRGILTLFVLLWALPVQAADSGNGVDLSSDNSAGIREVIVAGPSWEGFTGRDGIGLYHDILNTLFALYDIRVIRQYMPSERAYDLVRDGRADFMTCHDHVQPPLVLARHAMFENQFHVFFSKSRFPDWQGQESMRDSIVAWRIGYYDSHNFDVPVHVKEVKTGVSALGMVVLGRADFYVDDAGFIRDSMSKTTLIYDPDEYGIEAVGRRQYRPVFAMTERGAKVMDLYERGMEELWRRGDLQRIFAKWGHPLPHYDFSGTPAP